MQRNSSHEQKHKTNVILYYKTNCENSKRLINTLVKYKELCEKITFISLDNSFKYKNGERYTQLQNGTVLKVPPEIKFVPGLFIENSQNSFFLFENDIMKYFSEYINQLTKQATMGNGEVMEFTQFYGTKGGVISDSFGLLDEVYDPNINIENPENRKSTNLLHCYEDINNNPSNSGRGLLNIPIHAINQEINPADFMTTTQMAQGTQYNQNQFRIEKKYNSTQSFPKEMFLEGKLKLESNRQNNTTYNQNEFFKGMGINRDQEGNIIPPDALKPIETKKNQNEDELMKQRQKMMNERDQIDAMFNPSRNNQVKHVDFTNPLFGI